MRNESGRRRKPESHRLRASALGRSFRLEVLEGRQLLSTFEVTNLNASGAGSLRQAIVASNSQAGADVIDFQVAGTIKVGKTSLPAITDSVTIDGSSAPTFAGTPVVTVDFQGSKGLQVNKGADGSAVKSLSLVRAGGAGITLRASGVTVEGNDIGLLADGITAAGNKGDGIRIEASSRDNLIGHDDPVTGVSVYNSSSVGTQPVTAWQGIRASDTSGNFLIVGTSGSHGLLYDGPISGVGGTTYQVDVPGATSTSVYGPDNLDGSTLRLVGSYKTGNDMVQGFLYEGTTAGLSQASNYRTIDYPGAKFTYVHSTMGGLAVGNADGPEGNLPIGTGHAFLYDVATSTFLPDIVYPGSTSTTAYGIWANNDKTYTICGGYTDAGDGLGKAFLVDYVPETGQFRNWTSFTDPNGQNLVTHFEGISSVEKGVYTLSADSVTLGSSGGEQGSLVSVRQNTDGSFGPGTWVPIHASSVAPAGGFTSSNSVYGNAVVGIVANASGSTPFQATVNVGFQLSNVIAGNGGNGIGIYGSDDNRIAMNFIGTDSAGTFKRANARNGILITQGASGNLIGGEATGANDPTAGVFVRPPQGNLISGNGGSGVLINSGSDDNQLSGNFIGTAASGITPLGNKLDGVDIENCDGNSLLGCTFRQDPFVFYNVVSGNGRNGLTVHNSDDTTVQANYLGTGANNAAVVANGGDGLLISGNSDDTQVGGVIPLGNVISGNKRNGIEVRDTASHFTSFNTFAGIFAFAGAAPNGGDGILITSSGGHNLVRTSIVSGNLGDGIGIGGNATGVQVDDTAVGTNTTIDTPIPNLGDGIRIFGKAHDNVIGGSLPSIVPQVTVSSNAGYGVAILGSARDNDSFDTFVGTSYNGDIALGNNLGGIFLGAGSSRSRIGGVPGTLPSKIDNSGGNGVTIQSSTGNQVADAEISGNLGYGVFATGVDTGTVVEGNTITSNARGNVNLAKSRGVTYTS